MRAFILTTILLGFIYSFSATAAAKQLAYGDGKPDGKQPLAGTGAMVHFSAPGPTAVVTAVHVHSTRRGGAKEKRLVGRDCIEEMPEFASSFG